MRREKIEDGVTRGDIHVDFRVLLSAGSLLQPTEIIPRGQRRVGRRQTSWRRTGLERRMGEGLGGPAKTDKHKPYVYGQSSNKAKAKVEQAYLDAIARGEVS